MSRRNPEESAAGWYESGIGWTPQDRFVRWFESKDDLDSSIIVTMKRLFSDAWEGSYVDYREPFRVNFWYEKKQIDLSDADRKTLGLVGMIRLEESIRILFG